MYDILMSRWRLLPSNNGKSRQQLGGVDSRWWRYRCGGMEMIIALSPMRKQDVGGIAVRSAKCRGTSVSQLRVDRYRPWSPLLLEQAR